MPGRKQSDPNVFPDDWETKEFAQTANLLGGFAYSSSRFKSSGEYQVLKMSNLYGGRLDLERGRSFIDEPRDEELSGLALPNDILITLTGTTGKRDYGYTCLIKDQQKLLVNQRVGIIRIKDDFCPQYVFYQLSSSFFYKQFFDISKGGTGNQTNVGVSELSKILIPLPPQREEQEAIANALSEMDQRILSLEKLIDKKRLIKKGVAQELLIAKRRLPKFNGEWIKVKLGEIADLYQPQTISAREFTEAGFPVYGANGIVGFYSKTNHDTWQVTVTCRGSTCGTVNRTVDHCWITGNAMVIASDDERIDKQFLYYLLANTNLSDCITGTGQPQIVRGPLASVNLMIPCDRNEQVQIGSFLFDIDSEIEAIQMELEKTRLIKQGMMQELLTGRIRLI